MKVIYIAGKYRSDKGEWFVYENIRAAELMAQWVWMHGGVALCPHKNTAFFGGLPGCPDETWLEGDLELLKRCDAVFAISGWRESAGARAEVEYAKKNHIPVIYNHRSVISFLKQNA